MSSVRPSDFNQSNWSTIVNQGGDLGNVHFSRITGKIESKSGLFGFFSQFVNKFLSIFPGYELGLKKSAVLKALEYGMQSNNRSQDDVIRKVAQIIKPKLLSEIQEDLSTKVDEWEKRIGNPKPTGPEESDKAKHEDELGHQLLSAAESGDVQKVVDLINQGAPLDKKDHSGETPLHKAASLGNKEVIEALVKYKAPLNKKDGNGATPLHLAILFGYAEAAKCLIECGADLKAKDKNGQTPVHLAVVPQVKGFNQEIIKTLIDYQAPLDECNKAGFTPLQSTIRENKPEAAVHLIEGGADVNATDPVGNPPLLSALGPLKGKEMGKVALALIKRDADLTRVSSDNPPYPHLALRGNHTEVALELISRGASPNEVDPYETPLLHLALECLNEEDHSAEINELIERSKNLQQTNSLQKTALHIAAARGNLAATRTLINKTNNTGFQDIHGSTPLHHALECGHNAIAMLLIDRSEDVNQISRFGETPLHIAARTGSLEPTRALIEKTDNINAGGIDGQSALSTALECGHHEIAMLLIDSCQFWESSTLLDAAQRGYTDAVEALMKKVHDIDVNHTGDDGTTALHLAISHGHPETAIALLNHGAKFNIKSSETGEEEVFVTAEEMCQQRGEAMAEVLHTIETIKDPVIKG